MNSEEEKDNNGNKLNASPISQRILPHPRPQSGGVGRVGSDSISSGNNMLLQVIKNNILIFQNFDPFKPSFLKLLKNLIGLFLTNFFPCLQLLNEKSDDDDPENKTRSGHSELLRQLQKVKVCSLKIVKNKIIISIA